MAAKYGYPLLNPGSSSSLVLTGGGLCVRPMKTMATSTGFFGGLPMMAKNLSLDLSIRVNLVAMGGVDTEMWDHLGEHKVELIQSIEDRTITGKIGQVEDVVQAYLYCMKDKNVCGSTIFTEGGYLSKD
jgi:NAD(P)-dependent dehydrogenase (short-subunit alcohol dehydrogenase family)